MKRWLLALVLCMALLVSAGCSSQLTGLHAQNMDKVPVVTLEMADGEVIRMELYPAHAPNTVANFVTLVQSGFYDGLTFHRAVSDYIIQGGCPQGNGRGGPGYTIAGEFSDNQFKHNKLSHLRGVVSMARTNKKDTAGSQFFIMVNDLQASFLDGNYAAFGRVTDGMDVVESYSDLPIKDPINGLVVDPPVIKTATVEMNNYVLPTIEKVPQS